MTNSVGQVDYSFTLTGEITTAALVTAGATAEVVPPLCVLARAESVPSAPSGHLSLSHPRPLFSRAGQTAILSVYLTLLYCTHSHTHAPMIKSSGV